MSSAQSDPGVLESAYRTVTPGYGSHGDTEMDLVGLVLFLGILTLLFPLIPLFLLLVLGSKAIKAVRSTVRGPD
jgi:hypothetical protein